MSPNKKCSTPKNNFQPQISKNDYFRLSFVNCFSEIINSLMKCRKYYSSEIVDVVELLLFDGNLSKIEQKIYNSFTSSTSIEDNENIVSGITQNKIILSLDLLNNKPEAIIKELEDCLQLDMFERGLHIL